MLNSMLKVPQGNACFFGGGGISALYLTTLEIKTTSISHFERTTMSPKKNSSGWSNYKHFSRHAI